MRGLDRFEKRSQIKDIVTSSSVKLVLLMESKMKSMPRGFLHQVCPFALLNGVCLPSKGVVGGIWVVWDSSKLEILHSWASTFSISVRGRVRGLEVEWLVTGVYGPCVSDLKQPFFDELLEIRAQWSDSWCVCGDFNEITSFEERLGASSLPVGAIFFQNFIDACSLRDVPIVGAAFTWSNFHNPPSLSKLHRFLLSPEWDLSFSVAKGLARPRLVSDHIPLVLYGKMQSGDPKPFKFENMWLQSPGLLIWLGVSGCLLMC